jgi:hypothetical protein
VSSKWFPGIEFGGFLAGLDPVPPGIVPMAEWRAGDEQQPRPAPVEAGAHTAVARKNLPAARGPPR